MVEVVVTVILATVTTIAVITTVFAIKTVVKVVAVGRFIIQSLIRRRRRRHVNTLRFEPVVRER